MLEADGQAQRLPSELEPGWRKIYHRTFNLSLDVAEPIALFTTRAAKTCVIAEDRERALPVRVPVFFVGREGQAAGELKADAERTAFAPSATLDEGINFAEVRFRLRRGAGSFSDIRPFFACGLAGVMLCEGYCPGDMPALARLLADWAVNAPPAPKEQAAPTPEARTPEPSPSVAVAPKPSAPAPAPHPQTPAVEQPAPLSPKPPAVAEAPREPQQEAPSMAERPSAPETPAPKVTPETPPPVQPEAPKAPSAPDVAEAPPAPQPEAPKTPPAAAETQPEHLPETAKSPEPMAPAGKAPEAGPTAVAPAPAQPITRRLLLVFQRKSGEALSPAEILEAEGSIRIEGQTLRAAPEGLSTELPRDAYAKVNTPEALQKLFPHFKVLEVKAGEERTLIKAEPLQAPKPGSILIELVSTDSDFANQAGLAAVEGFWPAALDLASKVSEGLWERKVLARAQAPGVSADTKILENSRGGKLAVGPARDSILRSLIRGSRADAGSPALGGSKPIERIELDLALDPIRRDAGIDPREKAGQEALLLIAGGIDPAGGYFCRHPIRPDTSPWARPEWVSLARRIFVLEIWSDATAQALQRISRAKPAGGAPEGIYLCNVPGADGSNIALYGIVPKALGESARAGTFAYLAVQASNYLKP